MPNHFWQIIKRFSPNDTSFNKTFAETFALPEFRTLSSGAARACHRMIQIMASLKDFSEEAATQILSNTLLMDNLSTASDDEISHAFELEVATINTELEKEKLRLKKELEVTEREKAEVELSLQTISEKLSKQINEAKKENSILKEKFESDRMRLEQEKFNYQQNIEGKSNSLRDTEKKLQKAEIELQNIASKDKKWRLFYFFTISAIISYILIFSSFRDYLIQIAPFMTNIFIIISINLILIFGLMGLLFPSTRRLWWGSSIVGLLIFIFNRIETYGK
ncbi:hypothetical protein GTA51_16585 [Desulfovibrio aerotolerans]|uniref:Uncharacterized protein n=1 Tax=Solidesulfovibrio aerotolerans TaxID=295255 RepID=A0A7C9MQP9_9BACT|nr:hypothetical protein [Solidesulfovibrio aerotolerans]MYL84732.1 hypothetical protein [Solidesulfovibrio aerotolerans]